MTATTLWAFQTKLQLLESWLVKLRRPESTCSLFGAEKSFSIQGKPIEV